MNGTRERGNVGTGRGTDNARHQERDPVAV